MAYCKRQDSLKRIGNVELDKLFVHPGKLVLREYDPTTGKFASLERDGNLWQVRKYNSDKRISAIVGECHYQTFAKAIRAIRRYISAC